VNCFLITASDDYTLQPLFATFLLLSTTDGISSRSCLLSLNQFLIYCLFASHHTSITTIAVYHHHHRIRMYLPFTLSRLLNMTRESSRRPNKYSEGHGTVSSSTLNCCVWGWIHKQSLFLIFTHRDSTSPFQVARWCAFIQCKVNTFGIGLASKPAYTLRQCEVFHTRKSAYISIYYSVE